jgi:hypothetical protein
MLFNKTTGGAQLGPNPADMSPEDAYTAIREWYQGHTELLEKWRGERREWYSTNLPDFPPDMIIDSGETSKHLIEALPPAGRISELEMTAVFREVICGRLEWAFQETDNKYEMGQYARAALRNHGLEFSDEELATLRTSALWPYLFNLT